MAPTRTQPATPSAEKETEPMRTTITYKQPTTDLHVRVDLPAEDQAKFPDGQVLTTCGGLISHEATISMDNIKALRARYGEPPHYMLDGYCPTCLRPEVR